MMLRKQRKAKETKQVKNNSPQSTRRAGFLFADGLSLLEMHEVSEAAALCAISEADRNRLVEGSKSPTREKQAKIAKKWFYADRDIKTLFNKPPALAAAAGGAFSDLRDRETKQVKTDLETSACGRDVKTAGTATVIEFREWCDTYRVRTVVNPDRAMQPPSQSGERVSDMLSTRAARKIAESCQYLAEKFGGYKTFVTGTFDAETREKLKRLDEDGKPVTTIQKEVTRTMDALTKAYKRGWEYKGEDGEIVKIAGFGEAMRYCWVVEVPKNEHGEENPHIHILIDWSVPYKHFKAWSARIEKIWGNGYFHLEKIKDKDAAGAYMAKAAGYISKASGQNDQGIVRGNRYAISSGARAPDWVTVDVAEFGIMGRLIRETYDSIQHKHKEKFEQRRSHAAARDQLTKKIKAADTDGKREWFKKRRKDIAEKLVAVRKEINDLPIRATKYFLEIKGKETLDKFIERSKAVGWGDEKPSSTTWIYYRKKLREAWDSCELAARLSVWVDQKQGFVESAYSGWSEYEQTATGG